MSLGGNLAKLFRFAGDRTINSDELHCKIRFILDELHCKAFLSRHLFSPLKCLCIGLRWGSIGYLSSSFFFHDVSQP